MINKRCYLGFLGYVFLILSGGTSQEDHDRACPERCRRCKDAIERGLRYLASKQGRSGGWCDVCKKTLRNLDQARRRFPGEDSFRHRHVAYTALALLAFYAQGSSLQEGRYRKDIKKGVDFLIRAYDHRTGRIVHGIRWHIGQSVLGLLALLEIYSTSHQERLKMLLRRKIAAVIRYLRREQTQWGGWHYQRVGRCAHGGMTYGVLSALLLANKAGFRVSKFMIKKAKRYFKKAIRKSGWVRYEWPRFTAGYMRKNGDPLIPRRCYRLGGTFLALKLGGKFCPELEKRFDKLKKCFCKLRLRRILMLKNVEDVGVAGDPLLDSHYCYGILFATCAAKLIGGEFWEKWDKDLRSYLLKKQRKKGDWRFRSPTDEIFVTMPTAVSLILLQLSMEKLNLVKMIKNQVNQDRFGG